MNGNWSQKCELKCIRVGHGMKNKAFEETAGSRGNHHFYSIKFKRFCGRPVIPGRKKELRYKY